MPTRALLQKIMIKSHHAVNFRYRQVQLPRDERNRVLGNELQRILHCVQDRQECSGELLETGTGIENGRVFRGAQVEGRLQLDRDHAPGRTFTHGAKC